MSAGTRFTNEILARHGERPDVRIYRQETAGAWVGKYKGRTEEGHVVLWAGAQMIQAGLCKGSADIVGFQRPHGRIISIEVKAEGDTVKKDQEVWKRVVQSFGGLACVAWTMDDVDGLLGLPPGER